MGGSGTCVVPGCKNLGGHYIPREPVKRGLWMRALRLEEHDILKTKKPSVCRMHFKESDYNDSDLEPLNKYAIADQTFLPSLYNTWDDSKRRRLKTLAVPSIFPWNQSSATHESINNLPKELTIVSASEFEKDNEDTRDPLTILREFESTQSKEQLLQNQSLPPDLEDCDIVFPFDTSAITNKCSSLNDPINFIPELPYLNTGTDIDIPITDSLFAPEIDERERSFEEGNYFIEVHTDVTNSIGFADCDDSKLDGDDVSCSTVPSENCPTCGEILLYSVQSY